jgi:transposase
MDAKQFESIAKLIRSRDPSREGARLVLVEGLTRKAAAEQLGVTGETISKAVRRVKDADSVIRHGYGLPSAT